MTGSTMRGTLLLALLAAVPARAAAYDELGEAPTPWSAPDRAEFLQSCAKLRLAPALCECFLEPLQAHFPTYDAFQRNRDPAKDRTADLELQRCARRFRK
jgi:hypothetical protein